MSCCCPEGGALTWYSDTPETTKEATLMQQNDHEHTDQGVGKYSFQRH